MNTTAPANTIGSSGFTWNNTDAMNLENDIATTRPITDAHARHGESAPQHHPPNRPALRAEGHADAELAGAEPHAVGQARRRCPSAASSSATAANAMRILSVNTRCAAPPPIASSSIIGRCITSSGSSAPSARRIRRPQLGARVVQRDDLRERPVAIAGELPMRVIDVRRRPPLVVQRDVADDADDLRRTRPPVRIVCPSGSTPGNSASASDFDDHDGVRRSRVVARVEQRVPRSTGMPTALEIVARHDALLRLARDRARCRRAARSAPARPTCDTGRSRADATHRPPRAHRGATRIARRLFV